MATLPETHTAFPLTPESPRGVQPGGHGLSVRLELAWGRLRRKLLRRFRPVYVQRMAGLRLGHCPDCSHDVIDRRDLKFIRNVCGYSFGPDEDPYRRPLRLPLARPGRAEVFVSGLILGSLALL